MNKISTFEVDHEQLSAGVYIERQDVFGKQPLTTFDVRFKAPYRQAQLTQATAHTLEHLGAVYLRQHAACADKIVYWGPMGCLTGFNLLVAGEVTAADIVPTLQEMCRFIAGFSGEIPGTQAAWQCGNYQLHDLDGARQEARTFLEVLVRWTPQASVYPRREK